MKSSKRAEPGSVGTRRSGTLERYEKLAIEEEQRRHVKHESIVREETDADVGAISEVTVAAFKTLAISNHTEQFIITALRAAKALTVSLVAEVAGAVVGHIGF